MTTPISQHVKLCLTRLYPGGRSRVRKSLDLSPVLSRYFDQEAVNKVLGDELRRLEAELTEKEQAQARKDAAG